MKIILSCLALLCASPAAARPVVLELFTSQSCSSCPPAETLLASLQASRPDVLALSFHVDYWNALSWKDPFSSRAATDRQRAYSAALGTEVFTPQLVVDGCTSAVGSDADAVSAAIDAAQRAQKSGPDVTVQAAVSGLIITVAAGHGAGDVLLAGYDPYHETQVAAGENGGVLLKETNIVRSLRRVARWDGTALRLTVPLPAGQRSAVILQQTDGTVLAASLP
jgi:hypothetical protein